MSDEPALLRAIADDPDDIPLRLVYADWCEEHGRPARSALIRGQCALDPVIEYPPVDPDVYGGDHDPRYLIPRHLPLELREDVLAAFRPYADAEGLDWATESVLSSRMTYDVRRGFVERLTFNSLVQFRRWLPYAPAILSQVPIRELTVWRQHSYPEPTDPEDLPAEALTELLETDGIGRLRELDLSSFDLDPAAARVLLADGDALGLAVLRVRHRTLPPDLVARLEERFGDALVLGDGQDEIHF